ncbi:MAG: translocation/assembly module TamB domain-containing protein [Pseudomonadota bacterium]
MRHARLSLGLLGLVLLVPLLLAGPARGFDIFGIKNSLIQFALEQISSEDFAISAEAVESPGDGVTDLVGVQISDREGVWFTAERMGLQWNAQRILAGELEINRLTAAGVEVIRQPVGSVEVKEDADIAADDGEPFDWPRSPLPTRIDEVALERVLIAEGVIAPQSLEFDATGAVRDEGDEQSVRLTLTRTDAVVGEIRLDYLRDFAAGTLRANVTALEAPGGLVAALAGLPDSSASSLDLAADGPLTDWGLDFALVAEQVLEANGRARIDIEGPLAIQARFRARPGPQLPTDMAALLGQEARLDIDVEEADGVVAIREARLASPALTLEATGSYTRAGGLVDLDVNLDGQAALSTLADGVAFDGFGFDGRVTGALDDLTARGEAQLSGLTTDPADIGGAQLATEVRIAGSRIDFGVDGGAQAVRLDRLGPDLLGDADLAARGVYDADRLTLEGLAFRSRPLMVEASGTVDLAASSAALNYGLTTPDLAPLASAYDANAAGRLTVSGRVEGPFDAVRLTGEAAFEDLAFEDETYGRLAITHDVIAGETIRGGARLRGDGSRFGALAADVDFALAGERLDVPRLSADAMGLSLDGAVTYWLDTELADGGISLEAPNLAPLAEALDQPIAGAVSGRVTLAPVGETQRVGFDLAGSGFEGFEAALQRLTLIGSVEDARSEPRLAAELTAIDAAYQDTTVQRVTAAVAAQDLTGSPSGDLTATVTGVEGFGARVATADLKARIEDALAALPTGSATLRAGSVEAAGVAVASLALDATLTDEATDGLLTAALSTGAVRAGDAQIGSVKADATVTGPLGTAPAVEAKIATGRIAAGDASVEGIRADARLPNALAEDPRITARLDTGTIAAGSATLSGLATRIDGVLSALGITLSTEGEAAGKPVSLSAEARVDAAAETPVARVNALVAKYDTAEARLRSPLTITAGDTIRLRGLDMALPSGGITGDAALHPSGAEADLTLSLGDLGTLAELADAPLSAGSLDATVSLDSRPGRARGTADIATRGLRFAEAIADIGALDLTIDGTWDGRRAALDAALAGPFGDPVRVTAALPVRASGGPVPQLMERDPIEGRIRWLGDVGELWALVPAPGHVLDGRLDMDLGIGGTIAAPAIEGSLGLTEGRYENLDIGTILTDLTLRSAIRGLDTLELTAEARDAGEGRLTAEVAVDPERVAASLKSNSAVLVRRDDATAAITLDIRAEGPLAGPDIAGSVIIDRAEIRLVNAAPPSVITLGDVRIKGVPVEPPEEAAGNAIGLDIAIRAARDVFVRGRGMDSEWKIGMDVTGTAAKPRITGAIEKVRGRLNLIGTVFDLDTGKITFTGGKEVDPRLDVKFEADENGISGGIAVSGTGSDPEISFYSRPALPEDEVLPRLLFGKPSQSLTTSQAIRLASGIATLMDGSGGAVDSVRGAVGLDQLSIDPEGDTATVTVGKNVADDVFVGAKQSVDGASSSVFVEVEVFEDITVDSEVDQNGSASVGVNWRKDF